MKHMLECAAFGILLVNASCSAPTGPVSPTLVESPPTKVTITPDLTEFISVPAVANAQVMNYTEDGLLKYQFRLQNKSPKSFFLNIRSEFYDKTGAVVDQQGTRREAFTAHQIRTITVTCTNSQAVDVQVQVSPAG